jgi:hypothetical protein
MWWLTLVVTDSEWVMATSLDRAAPMLSEACIVRDSDVEMVVNSDHDQQGSGDGD